MAKTRAARRRRPKPTGQDRLLDGFFEAWSRTDTGKIASAIYKGHVTGEALALQLKWTRDKVSRRTDELRSAGIVAKRRDNGWMRTTLTTEGVEAARSWAEPLRADPSDPPPPAWTVDERTRAAGALASADRRRLLTQLVTTPGATQADLVAGCGLSQPTVSWGLQELKAAGLIDVHRDGGRARHHVEPGAVERLHAWLEELATKLAEGAGLSEAVVLPRAGQGSSQANAPAEAPSPAAQDLNDNQPRDGADDVSEPAEPSTPDAVDA